MFNVGGGELLVILVLALIVLGPQRLPDALRTVGRVMGEVKRISSGFQQDLTSAIQDMDKDDTPRRRREAVPLAAVVADADASGDVEDAVADDEDDDVDLVALSASPWGDDDGDDATLAPAISDALDEIVTPLPNAAEPDAAGESSGEGDGDERAAS
jgi:sec-independent protein translocase protein TatB